MMINNIKNLFNRKPRNGGVSNNPHRSLKMIPVRKDPEIVISLTSYGHRIQQTAPQTIASLLRQTIQPDAIVLWLAHHEKPSKELKRLEKNGLLIRFTDDIKSYKKLIPAIKEYPDSEIITVDDDMIYPDTWLEKTLKTYGENTSKIVANRAREVILKNQRIAPYVEWPLVTDSKTNSHFILPTGAGGVLYPPNSLDSRVVDRDMFMKLAPHADDLWFWAMAELKRTRRVLVEDGFSDTIEYELDNSNEHRLSMVNVDPNNKDNNDAQLLRILDEYPELYDNLSGRTATK